jgi:hypothetical protein
MKYSGRQWMFGGVAVAVVAVGAFAASELAGGLDRGTHAERVAPQPSGPAEAGTPSAATRSQPEGPTPAGPHTPGETPAWRTGASGATAPAGRNRTPASPADPSTQPAAAGQR